MLELLNCLIRYHTSQTSTDNRECKDAIMHCIFALFENMRGKIMNEEEWISHIYTKQEPLYCWTKDSIEQLKEINKIQSVFLCTSLKEDAYNETNDILFNSRRYKYKYKIYLKENTYGILLNSFSDASMHPNEEECIIQLSDIARVERINRRR